MIDLSTKSRPVFFERQRPHLSVANTVKLSAHVPKWRAPSRLNLLSTVRMLGVGLAALSVSVPAMAQTALPTFRSLDANGVDLVNGGFVFSFEEGSVGGGQNRLALIRQGGGNNASQFDGHRLSRAPNSQNVTISSSTSSELWTFNARTNSYTNGLANGGSLIRSGNE